MTNTIDEIEGLLARATPAPWQEYDQQLSCEEGRFAIVWPTNDDCAVWSKPDLALVIALRNLAPDLIAVVRAAAKVAAPNGMNLTTEAWGALEAALARLGVKP